MRKTRPRACVGGADEHAAVAAGGRLDGDGSQALGEDLAHLAQRDRADRAHRAQLGEHALHDERLADDARDERLEPVEPLAPRAVCGPRGELVDERQRERAQVLEVRQVALDRRACAATADPRGVLPSAEAVLGGEAVEPMPAIASGDDGGFVQPLFPFVRRAQRAAEDAWFGVVSADVLVRTELGSTSSGSAGSRSPRRDALGARGQRVVQRADGLGVEQGRLA